MTLSLRNSGYAFLIRLDLMFSMSLCKELQLLEILSDASITHSIKLWNHLNVNWPSVAENTKYLRQIPNLFITNQLLLQLETLSNCDNFTVITILYNNDVLTWDYKNNNKYQVTMS